MHAVQQAFRIVQAGHQQDDGKTAMLGVLNQRQFGFVGKHGFTDKRLLRLKQRGTPPISPLTRLLRTHLRVAEVLQVSSLEYVGVDEFRFRRNQAFDDSSMEQSGLASSVRAGQQIENGLRHP